MMNHHTPDEEAEREALRAMLDDNHSEGAVAWDTLVLLIMLAVFAAFVSWLILAPQKHTGATDGQATGQQTTLAVYGDLSQVWPVLQGALKETPEAAAAPPDMPSLPDCRTLSLAFVATPCAGWVFDLTQPALMVPLAFAEGAVPVMLDCEVRGILQTPYGLPWAAVGASGELGAAQINVRVHGPRMISMGLFPTSERDRMQYAIILHAEQDWRPWSCKP